MPDDRVTLKESIGKAISKGKTDPRIAALARAGRLGIILWHWKYAKEDRAEEALNLLTRRSAKRLRLRHIGEGKMEYRLLKAACRQALAEWYSPECAYCGGRGEQKEEHKTFTCPKCEGSGVRNYTEWERADALMISNLHYQHVWDRRFRVIHSLIVGKDAETGAKIMEQLTEDEAHLEIEEEITA
jgi:hypothetical protein